MFLGLSLTTWAWIIAVFIIITPIIGKQIAKDSLKMKDVIGNGDNHYVVWALFPLSMDDNLPKAMRDCPIQRWSQKKYIRQIMMGSVWIKFLFNVFSIVVLVAGMRIIYLILVFGSAAFRGIFSAK
ncbi:hypothetical protein KGQ34_02930 [Patescibacteria group bacterium]|nr:hypothetical protein [Patescibacteria group bacterium]